MYNIERMMTRFFTLPCIILLSGFFIVGASLYAFAQENEASKPQLVEITLNEETSDPEAVDVVKQFYNNWIKENEPNTKLGKVEARFIPIHQQGKNNRFIFAQLYDEPLGGCFKRGCRTIILRLNKNNEIRGVFNAFITYAWYDKSSTAQRPANLIFSSNIDKSNPGIWLWNGLGYQVVER
jgi:hypothetical protein